MSPIRRSVSLGLLATAVSLIPLAVAWAQPATSRADIEAAYQQDRAACLDSTSMHERSSCLREAGAVRAEAIRGSRLASPGPQDLLTHALQRCQRLPHDDKLLCERRIQGEGKVTGSVEAGGLLRELVVEVPAEPR